MVRGEGRTPLGLVRVALHVYGLWGFWVAQPLYDLIGQNPTFLIAQGADAATVLGFIVVLSGIAPAGLVLPIVVASRFGVAAGRGAYAAVLAGSADQRIASPAARWTTGQMVVIDGGATI